MLWCFDLIYNVFWEEVENDMGVLVGYVGVVVWLEMI